MQLFSLYYAFLPSFLCEDIKTEPLCSVNPPQVPSFRRFRVFSALTAAFHTCLSFLVFPNFGRLLSNRFLLPCNDIAVDRLWHRHPMLSPGSTVNSRLRTTLDFFGFPHSVPILTLVFWAIVKLLDSEDFYRPANPFLPDF